MKALSPFGRLLEIARAGGFPAGFCREARAQDVPKAAHIVRRKLI